MASCTEVVKAFVQVVQWGVVKSQVVQVVQAYPVAHACVQQRSHKTPPETGRAAGHKVDIVTVLHLLYRTSTELHVFCSDKVLAMTISFYFIIA